MSQSIGKVHCIISNFLGGTNRYDTDMHTTRYLILALNAEDSGLEALEGLI